MKKSFIHPMAEFIAFTYKTFLSFQFSKRWMVAISYGVLCHVLFTISVLAMLVSMFFGMSQSFWESTSPLFSFRQLTFNNSVSFSPLFLIILDGKEIFTLFFTKKLFIVTCTYCVCSTRIHSIIYTFLFLDTHQNYYLASVWNVFFSNVLTLQLILVIADLVHY